MAGGNRLEGGWEKAFPAVGLQRMFDVISSFDSYPHFVPGCLAARVLERESAAALKVETVFGIGPARFGFISRAVIEQPGRIRLTSSDGPWRAFSLNWTLASESMGCRVGCRYSADFRSWLIARAVRLGAGDIDRQAVAVLERRAAETRDALL